MTPEGAVLRQILDWLAAKHILAFRMQVGGMAGENSGKKWFMRFGTPGMADILAFPRSLSKNAYLDITLPPLWIECKAAKGRQSELQKSFQAQVERDGHRYIIARSVDDVEATLNLSRWWKP